ncbi:Basic helix-loop-helix DNA-binding superfamily protein isoform 1 [Tripterygium wilfordii]|uniref:Basic helix-loop-helix DNA-binding superfamily protein isoform 1 n=1 Tax=Tripterygium wilfordii TaxID=458696 RepID=A0A7J7CYI7_TRIWF|nr:transcription factor bHLH68-like isoform X2 [Tripterygium wilfordii]KAF5739161.1 Basic helix-loop-helix DNA-binding superfamily protein isoform 1 [Tripterygium wilfordii]
MMAGNPSWWSMYPPQYVVGSATSLPLNSFLPDNQEPPHQSWSQLLLGGLSAGGGEERFGLVHFQPRRLENWDDQILNYHPSPRMVPVDHDHVKQEISKNSNFYSYGEDEFQATRPAAAWSQQVMPVVSSPMSCVTSLSSNNNILNFSYDKANRHPADQSSECNSTATGGVCKKARVQASSSQPPLKVRKEKLGDRITALHQLVSPFGKTDTASVLLEALGYIRFLQGQIEALSSPYMGTASSSNIRNQHFEGGEDEPRDLKSRGLCLVPVSFTQHVGSENGADYWAPAVGGGF